MIKAKLVTFNDNGRFIGKKLSVHAHYCSNENPQLVEVSLIDKENGNHQSIYIDAKSLFKELSSRGVK